MNTKRHKARWHSRLGLLVLAWLVGLLVSPNWALASPGCQALNGQSGALTAYQYTEFLGNNQPVNQGDQVTLTASGQVYYVGSFLQMSDSGGTVSGTEGGSGAGADGIENLTAATVTFSVTCQSIAPVVSGVSPSSSAPGSTITITGSGFYGATAVSFGGTPATSFTVNNASSITAAVPNGSGTVSISVTTDAGTATGSSFTFAAPTANAVSATVAFDSGNNAIALSVAGNPTSVAVAGAPSHGVAVASGTSITYKPNAGYAGPDSFTYTASNAAGTSSPATVSISISAPTLALSPTSLPNAVAESSYSQTLAASGGTAPYTYAMASGALPPGLSLNASTGLLSGTTLTAGTFNFTVRASDSSTGPAAPFSTTQSYTLTVSAPSITITPASLPSGQQGTAYSQQLSAGGGNGAYAFSLSGNLPAGLTLSPAGLLSGTPTTNGSFSFTVVAKDGNNFSGSQAYPLAVGTPTAPTVSAKSASTAYNTPISINLSAAITGVDITAVVITGQPSHGTVSVSGETVTYTPSSTFYGGSDSFTYTATNPGGTSTPGTVTINVGTPAAPMVTAKSASTAYNTAAAIDLTSSITGAGITSVSIAAQPAHGTASVSGKIVTYTPSSTLYGGSDSFTYTATNSGGTSSPATVTINVGTPVAPTVAAKSVSTVYNTTATIDLASSITGVDITSVSLTSRPAHGTVNVSGETVTYTPSSTFYAGADSFTYTATNPGGTSSPATVNIAVTPLNVPSAAALSVATTTGTPVVVDAIAGAGGQQPFTGVSVAAQPTHGTATVSGNQITYAPTTGFTGIDTFKYEVSNHFGSSQPATISVTVTAAGRAAGHSTTVTTAPGSPVAVNLAGIAPGSYVSSALLGLSPGNSGSVTLSQPVVLTFAPQAGFHGLVQITALLTTETGNSVTVDVLVLVSDQPDPSKNPNVLGLVDAQTTQAQRFAQSQLGNIQSRLESLHDNEDTSLFSNNLSVSLHGKPLQMTGGARTSGASIAVNGVPADGSAMRQGIGAAESGETPSSSTAPSSETSSPAKASASGLGVWIGGSANFGSFDAYRQASGFDSDNIAVNAGADQRIGQHGVIGLSVGYNHDNSDIGNDGTRSVAKGYSAALYGSLQPAEHVYIDGVLGGGGLSFDSRRYGTDTGTFLVGHRNGSQWFGSLSFGYEYKTAGWLFSPYGRFEGSLSSLNSYSETGDVAEALTYGSQTVRTTQAIAGIRASGQVALGAGIFIPHVRLEVGHDFQGTSDTALSYAFVPSAGSWSVLSNPYTANGTSVELGVGGDLQLPGNLLITTDYEYLAQPHAHDQSIRLGVKKGF
ncbi:MAG TPA: Ig-like domain-containing protein [Dyella sp.]|uniref:Ig-like domain-containing protein n=1 Tax=Dyella sp. TaxID=1869338 RepID=UPI002CD7F7F0|nr:Ig-like domain-containing protein [Dyella sp.]HUB91962.1 Ig-like domain-containing protein [Dyella sp.]